MKLPTIRGVIDRRILANFRVEPGAMAAALPPPFRPKLINGYAIGGICLIRLKHMRPAFLPAVFGLNSENAAHRVAVQWDDNGQTRQGVYVPRRDTDSRLNALAGGSIFPGVHHHATFDVEETGDRYSLAMRSDDGAASVRVNATLAERLPATSVFASVAEASAFFEAGAVGYSDTTTPGRYDGMELRCSGWQVEPLDVQAVASSYFEDASRFPGGSAEFDCALLMRDINHAWHSREDLCCTPAAEAAAA